MHIILRSHILHVFARLAVAADFLVVDVSESQMILQDMWMSCDFCFDMRYLISVISLCSLSLRQGITTLVNG